MQSIRISPRDMMLWWPRRVKHSLFSYLHKYRRIAQYGGKGDLKIAFGERNNYSINPFYITIDVRNADVCLNFNDSPILPFADSTACTIFSSHALEHLGEEKVNVFLREAFRVLRPGGKLMIEVPDCQYLYEKWKAGERKLFNEFLFDKGICEQIGHPEIHDRLDIAFGNVISCMNGKNIKGEYQHMPVFFEAEKFKEQFSSLSMDDFFDWLINLQSAEEKLSGGHVSAWYPDKFTSALAKHGFKSIGKVDKPDMFLFRNSGIRHSYSLRLMASK